MRRLDGVFDVKVDLKQGEAVIKVQTGQPFDPVRIPQAVRRAGFTPGPIHLVAVGPVRIEGDQLLLDLGKRLFLLSGGERFKALKKVGGFGARPLKVTGVLKVSGTTAVTELLVEDWDWAGAPH